jgi:leucyl aminopeptidase
LKDAAAGAQALPDAPSGPAAPSEGSVWVSVGRADVPALRRAGLVPSVAATENARAAVYPVSPDSLPKLSAFMHEAFRKCAGFFAHRTRAEAERDLKPAPARVTLAYTMDQQSSVKPLLPRVTEGGLKSTIDTLAAYNNRYYEAGTGEQSARWIAARWKELAGKLPGASVELVAHDGWKQPSVILTIPGSDLAGEIVVLGGHEDSINGWGGAEKRAPGADDNASGIAVLTETIRVLGQSGWRPRRTLQFMAYAAEEVGLRGSQDIAQRYASEGKKVVGVIQYDMTNFKGSENDIYLLQDNVDAGLTAFLGRLIDAYLPGVTRGTLECGYACSDHASWTQNGYASACPFESSFDEMNHHIHTDSDTLANSGGNAAHSVPFAKLAVAFAVEMAKTARGAVITAR